MSTYSNNELQRMCAGIWWLVLLRSIITGFLGILLITRPVSLITVIILFMGTYWFVDGILTLVASIIGRKTLTNWGWGIFVGIVGILAGLVVFAHPVASAILTTKFLVYFLALAALIYGISGIVTGIRLRNEINVEWSMIFGGVLSVLFGVILMGSPLVPVLVLANILGIIAILSGIILAVSAFRLRRFAGSMIGVKS
jgi:uncharacterized membrane protein HdeD (DUF308 family)